ncbi:MAG: phosphopantetheine-binding protein [Pseudomonadota bacterium]
MTRLPVGASGKVDRSALPAVQADLVRSAPQPPQGDNERAVAEAIESLLGLEDIGRNDDFFALGGRSLLAVRLVAHLEAETARTLTLRQLFEGLTVAEIVSNLTDGTSWRASPLNPLTAPNLRRYPSNKSGCDSSICCIRLPEPPTIPMAPSNIGVRLAAPRQQARWMVSSCVTCRALDQASSRLADRLVNQRIGCDSVDAICLERSAEMLIGLVAMWKSGGRYLLLDRKYPSDRLN